MPVPSTVDSFIMFANCMNIASSRFCHVAFLLFYSSVVLSTPNMLLSLLYGMTPIRYIGGRCAFCMLSMSMLCCKLIIVLYKLLSLTTMPPSNFPILFFIYNLYKKQSSGKPPDYFHVYHGTATIIPLNCLSTRCCDVFFRCCCAYAMFYSIAFFAPFGC